MKNIVDNKQTKLKWQEHYLSVAPAKLFVFHLFNIVEQGMRERVDHGRVSKLWVCREPGCNKVYTKSYLLKLHLYTHSGKQPHKVSTLEYL